MLLYLKNANRVVQSSSRPTSAANDHVAVLLVKQEEDESASPPLTSTDGHIHHGMETDAVMQYLETPGL
jgi:hypothetical protein